MKNKNLTVGELIEELKKYPKDAEILYFYDSAPRGYIEKTMINKQGVVILYDEFWPIKEEDFDTELNP